MAYTALVQPLVCLYLVPVLVSDPHQEEPSLPAVDGDLPDDFIEALVVELLSDGADANLFGEFGE